MFKTDLHTHSAASPDGGISPRQYAKALETGLLDYIAITDHDRIDFAVSLQKTLGDKIIVGEEITTSEGEIIGLFLKERVIPGLTALETAHAIRRQGGLIYIPHPFETIRNGITNETLDQIAELVDIVEVYNGRAVFQNFSPESAVWAKTNVKAGAASSDAHGFKGLGGSYSVLAEVPSRDSLTTLLNMERLTHGRPPLYTLLYPKLHRVAKKLRVRQ